ncbi:TetR/AcrR family transcriptional regulator [Smaragdicoccus niigatensis]|uniref:TetR/AcrR family transcriptional regulator n=1 Tax=Smaragdicoccus niigatensis TaxID=359359 RepID=UPI00036D12F6|nr:TetR/AcrR family transcriptional regulator [Smaragdicoccus niigatensis]
MSQVNDPNEPGVVDGRSTRWDDHRADRRDRLLRSAIEAIDEDGPDVGVQEIATRAEIPRSVVYRIFKDRDDLDRQIKGRIIEDLMVDLAPTLSLEGTIGTSISRAVNTYVAWIVAHPRLHQFAGRRSTRTGAKPSVASRQKRDVALGVAHLIETFLRTRDSSTEFADSLAFGLIGMVDATVNRWLTNPDRTLTAEQLSRFLEVSIWQMFEGVSKRSGLDITPDTPIGSLVSGR